MSTIHEIEARIAATQDHLTKRIDALNERVTEMAQRINSDMHKQVLVDRFKEGGRVEQYNWNYEYSFQPGRRCFTSDKILVPGIKAYRGTWTVGKIMSDPSPQGLVYPEEIWLTKEEFTVRRLKGQI